MVPEHGRVIPEPSRKKGEKKKGKFLRGKKMLKSFSWSKSRKKRGDQGESKNQQKCGRPGEGGEKNGVSLKKKEM